MKRLLILLVFSGILIHAMGSDLVSVAPVTDQIVMLYFDDGHIDYGSASQGISANKVYNHPLNTGVAGQLSSYSFISEDDPDFQPAVSPVAIGRKTKGTDYNAPWIKNNPWILGHRIYIELPKRLKRGKTYTIRLGINLQSSVDNRDSVTFMYDEFSSWSPTIHVNQIGYKTSAPAKYAYLSQWMGDFNHEDHLSGGLNMDHLERTPFHVVNQESGKAVYSGTIELRRDKSNQDSDPLGNANLDEFAPERNFTHADVWQCDFSDVGTPGTYRIVVEQMGCSYPFRISEDPYFEPFHACMKGLFIQRQGIHKYIEPGLELPRDHHPDDVDVRYNPDFKFWVEPNHGPENWVDGIGTEVYLWGGYHDAGDWDTYPHHVKVPLALMMLYDLTPEKFADGDIGNRYKLDESDKQWIDEGTNGVPDILDEARWLMDFYRRGRDELMHKNLGSGGVPGEYFGRDAGADFGPWQDTREWAVTAESPAATYYLAAMTAWYAVCLEKANAGATDESIALLQEAKDAYLWATKYGTDHPSEVNDAVKEARYLAAACLYRTTGETGYQNDLVTYIDSDNSFRYANSDWSNPNTWFFAASNYVFLPSSFPGLNHLFKQTVVSKVIQMSEENKVKPAQTRGFRLGFSMHRNFSLGTFSTPRMLGTAMAYELTEDEKFLETIYFANDYFLGGNELNTVQVTGIGEHPNWHVFHPASWEINHYNSKVYSDESLPGLVTYFGDDDTWVGGPGDETWARSSAWPSVEHWPESESRFDSRQSINGSEFTIHQSILQAAVSYGYLVEGNNERFTANQRPTVQMVCPEENQQFAPGSDILMQVNVSPDVARVQYYRDEHFIDESSTPPFSMVWKDAPEGSYTITAKVYDEEGLIARPINEENDVDVHIVVGPGREINTTGVQMENCPDDELLVGYSCQMVATVLPKEASDHDLQWVSDNEEVLTVNSLGQVYTTGMGTAKISAITKEGKHEASCYITVGEKSPLGISGVNEAIPCRIYPNPAGQKVHIEGINEPFCVIARDAAGRMLFRDDEINHPVYKLDVSTIPSGLYLLQIITKSNKYLIRKMIRY